MSPFEPEIPLGSQYVIESQEIHPEAHEQSPLRGDLLTGEDGLNAVGLLQFSRHITPADRVRAGIGDVCYCLPNASVPEGRQVSPFPAMIRPIAPRIWEEIKLETIQIDSSM
jgi:hypothetical protein